MTFCPQNHIFTYGVACGAIRSINGSGKNLRDEGGLVFTFCYLWFAEILWILLLLVCRNFVTWRDGEDWCQDFDTSFVPKFCRILYFWCAKILWHIRYGGDFCHHINLILAMRSLALLNNYCCQLMCCISPSIVMRAWFHACI